MDFVKFMEWLREQRGEGTTAGSLGAAAVREERRGGPIRTVRELGRRVGNPSWFQDALLEWDIKTAAASPWLKAEEPKHGPPPEWNFDKLVEAYRRTSPKSEKEEWGEKLKGMKFSPVDGLGVEVDAPGYGKAGAFWMTMCWLVAALAMFLHVVVGR